MKKKITSNYGYHKYYKLPEKYDFYCTKYDNKDDDFKILSNNLVNMSLNYKNKNINYQKNLKKLIKEKTNYIKNGKRKKISY